MNDEEISRLRELIARAQGRDRAVPLIKLGWACLQEYVNAPSGSHLARQYLDEGVAVLEEGCPLLGAGDPVRAQVEATLGNYHASQGTSYWCEGEHLAKASGLLRSALDSGSLVPVMADFVRFHLARVHLSRYLATPDGSAHNAELDGARELLLGIAERALTRSLDQDARILLAALAEPSRRSLEAVADAMRNGDHHVPLTGHAEFDPKINGRDGRRYPHTLVVRGSTPETPFQPTPLQEATVDVERMRRAAWKLLHGAGDPEEPDNSALRLLCGDDELPWLDHFLALAAAVVDAARPATAADHTLLALGFLLRSRSADDGWDVPDDTAPSTKPAANGDFQAALAALLAALHADR